MWGRNLGKARLRHSFPWRELLDAGATLACGSDWPVMSADPLWGVAVATTRRDAKGRPAEGWYPEQRMTVGEVIDCYSVGAAAAIGRERDLGRIAAGFLADLVVLSPAVALDRPETLWQGDRVRYVVVDGRVRFAAGGEGSATGR